MRLTGGQIDGETEGQTEGQTDGEADGETDGHRERQIVPRTISLSKSITASLSLIRPESELHPRGKTRELA